MSEDKKNSILTELIHSKGYEIALMTTFNFEISFFERVIVNRLLDNDIKSISLYVDAKELKKALKETSTSYIGKRYMVNPIEMNGAFHPKIILLLGKEKAKLYVGSCNLKTTGYFTNFEIYNSIEYDKNKPEYLDVINKAIDFFDDINNKSYKLDDGIIKKAKSYVYYHKCKINEECCFIGNMNESVLKQASRFIKEDINEIKVVVPYYDNVLGAYKALCDEFTNSNIELYIQNKKSTFPMELNKKNNIASSIKVFSGFDSMGDNCERNFYHGKVYLFKGKENDYILYGSANCTQSALVKTYADGGNIECNIIEKGSIGEFDYFFDDIKLEPIEVLECHKMAYESERDTNYFYRYGKIEENAELHIGYVKKYNNIEVSINHTILDYEYKENELIVKIPFVYLESKDDIFEINIKYEDKNEVLRCWCYSELELDTYRNKQIDRDSLESFDIDSTGDRFIQDRINLLNAEKMSVADYMEYMKNMSVYNQIKMEQEDGYEDDDSDEIIVIDIPDECRAAYKQYKVVEQIRHQFINRFLFGSISVNSDNINSILPREEKSDTISSVDTNKPEYNQKQVRRATSEEKSFERFVKNKIKGILNDNFVEIVDIEHYISLLSVVIDIFTRYTNYEKVEGIFDVEYVIITRNELFKKLLSKNIDIKTDNYEDLCKGVIAEVYVCIIDSRQKISDIEDEYTRIRLKSSIKSLLMTIEKKYMLRDLYREYILYAMDKKLMIMNNCKFDCEEACDYIEELYGYKSKIQLINYIEKRYVNANVVFDNGKVGIYFETNELKNHNVPSKDVLREIKKYSLNVEQISTVIINVKKTEEDITENIKCTRIGIEHRVSIERGQWSVTDMFSDGRKNIGRLKYMDF